VKALKTENRVLNMRYCILASLVSPAEPPSWKFNLRLCSLRFTSLLTNQSLISSKTSRLVALSYSQHRFASIETKIQSILKGMLSARSMSFQSFGKAEHPSRSKSGSLFLGARLDSLPETNKSVPLDLGRSAQSFGFASLYSLFLSPCMRAWTCVEAELPLPYASLGLVVDTSSRDSYISSPPSARILPEFCHSGISEHSFAGFLRLTSQLFEYITL